MTVHSNKETHWHDIGPIETLKKIAPNDEKKWFDELYDLPYEQLNTKLFWIEKNTKDIALQNTIKKHRHSDFFLNCKPDSYRTKYD